MTLTATIDATGISAPDYPTILASLVGSYQAIYGADTYLEPDSQDGAFLAIFALAMSDTNSMAISTYNQFSPASAQGEGLSRAVKVNGLTRLVPTYSQADVDIGGSFGTTLINAIVTDASGVQWVILGTVTIPAAGVITATAEAVQPGAIVAPAGSLTGIGTPTRGWQTVTNRYAALVGAPVESDSGLRARQAVSTALPSRSIFEGMQGAILAIPGVARLKSYENDSAAPDANGIPSHTLCFVVDGGDPQTIANTISVKKGPGTDTYGDMVVTVVDVYLIPHPIRFYRPRVVVVNVEITIQALPGYIAAVGSAIIAAVVAYIQALPIAAPVRISRLYVPIDGAGATFNLLGVRLSRVGGPLLASDIIMQFIEAVTCTAANVTLTVIP